ncbi:DUF1385 domain-containing protein, partial [bacterium]
YLRDNKIGKIIIAPGLWLQRITTKPPDKQMLEVAITALLDSLCKVSINARSKGRNKNDS